MTEKSEYDDPASYEPLPIFVYPEGKEWVASAFGYDLVQRASGCKQATRLLFEGLRRLDWVSEKQGFVMHQLKNKRELNIWKKERKTGKGERRALKESKRSAL
jgi:hypothetical protein